MHFHVRIQLMFLGKRTAAQVAEVWSDARVHGPQVSTQHLTQQESATAFAALKTALAAVCQHVTRQLTAPRTLARAHVADELLLLVNRVDVVLVAGVRLKHRAAERTLHGTLFPHRPGGCGLLLLGRQVVWLFMDETVHSQVESVFHASAALRALMRLRVARHVHHEVVLGAEPALADSALELIRQHLHQCIFEVHGRLLLRGGLFRLGLEGPHVVDADVPAQLLDRGAHLRALGALERRHVIRLVYQLRVEIQPVCCRVFEGRLLAAMDNALVTLKARYIAEAFAAFVTRLARWNHAVLLGKHLQTLRN